MTDNLSGLKTLLPSYTARYLPPLGSGRVNCITDSVNQGCSKQRVADREVDPLQVLELQIDDRLGHLRARLQTRTTEQPAKESTAAARVKAEALLGNKVGSVVVCVSLDCNSTTLRYTHDAYLGRQSAAVVEVTEIKVINIAVAVVGSHRWLTLGYGRQIKSRERSNVARAVWYNAKHVGKTGCLS